MQSFLQRQWQSRSLWAWLWAPMSVLVCSLAWLKRRAYRLKLLRTYRSKLPVIVVGNLTVGGTGKSPLVIHIVNELIHRGFKPAIVTRGYKGQSKQWPLLVNRHSDTKAAGDEPVLLAQRTGVPVMAGPDRVASVKKLAKGHLCNVVVCDDGFQHLRLGRDLDILVIDGQRRYGNGWCLPSGPLREAASSSKAADWVIANGSAEEGELAMSMSLQEAYRLDGSEISSLENFDDAHAVAGIGHPERFFSQLESAGVTVIRHAFDDHHALQASDLEFNDDLPILMTEKDAVKCRELAQRLDLWVVPVTLSVDPTLIDSIVDKIKHG